MSRLIIGTTCFKDVNSLVQALAELLEDPTLIASLKKMLKLQGVTMSGYDAGQSAKVDFYVSKNHKNFTKAFGRQSWTDLGFKKESKVFNMICDNPKYFASRIAPRYSENVVKRMAKKIGLKVRKRNMANGNVKLTLFN